MRPEYRPAGDAAEAGSCSKAIPRCPAKGQGHLCIRFRGPGAPRFRHGRLPWCRLPLARAPRVPDAMQRERQRSGASLIRDPHATGRSRFRKVPGLQRTTSCCAAPGTRRAALPVPLPLAGRRPRGHERKTTPSTARSSTKRSPAAAILGPERRRAVAADHNEGRHEEIVHARRVADRPGAEPAGPRWQHDPRRRVGLSHSRAALDPAAPARAARRARAALARQLPRAHLLRARRGAGHHLRQPERLRQLRHRGRGDVLRALGRAASHREHGHHRGGVHPRLLARAAGGLRAVRYVRRHDRRRAREYLRTAGERVFRAQALARRHGDRAADGRRGGERRCAAREPAQVRGRGADRAAGLAGGIGAPGAQAVLADPAKPRDVLAAGDRPGMREPHWHPATAEMGYVLQGRAP
jgi:hypothetical protein